MWGTRELRQRHGEDPSSFASDSNRNPSINNTSPADANPLKGANIGLEIGGSQDNTPWTLERFLHSLTIGKRIGREECNVAIPVILPFLNDPKISDNLVEIMFSSPWEQSRRTAHRVLLQSTNPALRYLVNIEDKFLEIEKSSLDRWGNPSKYAREGGNNFRTTDLQGLITARLVEMLYHEESSNRAEQILANEKGSLMQQALENLFLSITPGFSAFTEDTIFRLLTGSRSSHVCRKAVEILHGACGTWSVRRMELAAALLGTIPEKLARNGLIRSVFMMTPKTDQYLNREQNLNSYWIVRFATAQALHRQMDDSIRAILLPLISGNHLQTAWRIGKYDSWLESKLRFVGAWRNGPREIHDIRAQVAIALRSVEPQAAIDELYKLKREYRGLRDLCGPAPRRDIYRALEELEGGPPMKNRVS